MNVRSLPKLNRLGVGKVHRARFRIWTDCIDLLNNESVRSKSQLMVLGDIGNLHLPELSTDQPSSAR